MVDQSKCIGCGACESICPVGAIKLGDNGKAQIDTNICIQCGACENTCPVEAITIHR